MLIDDAVVALGPGPLHEQTIARWLRPLFTQTLAQGGVYLANHTLGRPLDQMQADLAEGTRAWATLLRGAWVPWLAEEQAYRAALAELLGLSEARCVVPKISAGHALRTVLHTLPVGATVVTTQEEFASVAVTLAQFAALGRVRVVLVEARAAALVAALRAQPGASLVVVSQVFYADGRLLTELSSVAEACRAHGAELLVDCYHGLGVVPTSLAELGCDYLIGGCYKYLRGGPGAAFLALAPQVVARGVRPLDAGWFAQEPGPEAAMNPWRGGGPRLQPGGDGWLADTPPVLTYYQARSGLALLRALGVARLRAYSLAQLKTMQGLLAERGIASVGGDAGHGAFLTIATPNAEQVVARMAEAGIVVDARAGRVRVCPDVLTTGEELGQAADALRVAMRG